MIAVVIIVGMLAIVWFGADKSGRKEIPFPAFNSRYGPPGGGENPYAGKMAALGAVFGVAAAIVTGILVYLAHWGAS